MSTVEAKRYRDLKDAFEQYGYKLLNDHRESLPDAPVFLDLGYRWDCPKSPFGLCVYHRYESPRHDGCVFCGDPEERK